MKGPRFHGIDIHKFMRPLAAISIIESRRTDCVNFLDLSRLRLNISGGGARKWKGKPETKELEGQIQMGRGGDGDRGERISSFEWTGFHGRTEGTGSTDFRVLPNDLPGEDGASRRNRTSFWHFAAQRLLNI